MSDTYYTFSEVIKELGITSNELNEFMASGKLNPVRHEGRLKFKKDDVDRINSPQNHLNSQVVSTDNNENKAFYSWDEALNKLQIENEELKRFISDGDVQAYQEKDGIMFAKDEIDNFVNNIMDQGTIVVQGKVSEIIDDEPIMQLSIPTLQDLEKNIIPTIESYSLDDALRELQIEEPTLHKLVEEGEIQTVNVQGKVQYSKEDIDKRRQTLQVEATIVMPQQNIEIEDDEAVEPIVISANYSSVPEAIKTQPDNISGLNLQNLYSYEDTLQKLEMNSLEFDACVKKGEIQVIHLGDGFQRFKKEDVEDLLKNKMQPIPMVISPDDDFVSAENDDNKKGFTKSFYTLAEAAEHLKMSADKLLKIVEKENIKTYRMNKLKNIKRNDLIKLCSTQLIEDENIPIGTNYTSKKTEEKPISMSPKPKPKKEALDNTIVLPLVDFESEEDDPFVVAPKPQKSKSNEKYNNYAPPTEQPKNTINYYSFNEALNILQMEKEDLESLIRNGKLNCYMINGVRNLKKAEVNEYKSSKMVEPTIMMDDSGDDILEEDDDIFFIS